MKKRIGRLFEVQIAFNFSLMLSKFTPSISRMMTKEQLDKTIKALKNLTIDFKMDTYINGGNVFLRGIYINRSDQVSPVKTILDKDILSNFRFRKSYIWYLGEKREVTLMKLKKKMEIPIPELESYQVNNYA